MFKFKKFFSGSSTKYDKLDRLENVLNGLNENISRIIHSNIKIESSIEVLNEKITDYNNRRFIKYKELPLNEDIIDYENLVKLFYEKYFNDTIEKFERIKDSIQDCIIQYDKSLYFGKPNITFAEAFMKLTELKILRNYIIHLLFGTQDVKSFYFYAVNTKNFYDTALSVPHIDMNKIFLLDYEEEMDNEYYIIINMRRENIIIVSPTGDYEMENRYRKTVLRVLYSIYFEKYFIYNIKDLNNE